eukprot:TRINITY_DN11085_c0_g1_i1.p1 TRINITY_DN11085_c0_g1~~TRINITY_DN11085_c0_g1_i1.p1  ORF type:complete len:141 (-),score=22.06 TRINITY_DN11085_c0_g1_i1:7-429(-)
MSKKCADQEVCRPAYFAKQLQALVLQRLGLLMHEIMSKKCADQEVCRPAYFAKQLQALVLQRLGLLTATSLGATATRSADARAHVEKVNRPTYFAKQPQALVLQRPGLLMHELMSKKCSTNVRCKSATSLGATATRSADA